ncbi:MAG: diguanylate cyclase [Chitinivibrionales bacterium]|nr:diguanylate cyclase [Chitinivibrionales bacterium]
MKFSLPSMSFGRPRTILSQVVLGASATGAINMLMLGAAVLLAPRWPLVALCAAVALAATITAVYLLRGTIEGYERKVEKSALTARRFQNISKYFESILQDSTDIILSVDQEGYILKFNNGSEMHFGYTQEEIVGKPLGTLFVNEEDERRILAKVLLDGKASNNEVPMKTKEGKVILLNMSVSEMITSNNQIMGLVVTAKDITEKKKLEIELLKKNEQLNRLAITDSLTELYNSRHFFDQIKRELSRFNRNPSRPLSMLLIDIDHFKELNDTEGHQMGDQVLRSLGEIIRVCIRKNVDTGYRYGGDEFVVILPDTDKEKAKVVAERIQKQFGSFAFGNTSLSIGITEAKAGEDTKQLLSRADEAMYTSKRGGRNKVSVL